MIKRELRDTLSQSPKSILLLGPRQVGKSTLLESLHPDLSINLASQKEYLAFTANPSELEERIDATHPKLILIDEIQRVPELLNSIQVLIDQNRGKVRFLLSGSSARKLKRGAANLLPGRLLTYRMGPLSCAELGFRLNTQRALALGTLPEPYSSETRLAEKILESYSSTYVQEEILQESMIRQIHGFSRFLHVIAAHSGLFLDLSKTATKAKVDRSAARRYIEILEDSLICEKVDATPGDFDLVKHPRLYFFDNGVLNGLLNNFKPSEDRKGLLLEHLFYNQLRATAYALDQKTEITHFRTRGGLEVDFIVKRGDRQYAIEVKSSAPAASELRPLQKITDYFPEGLIRMVAADIQTRRKVDGISILPWQEAIREIFFPRTNL